MLQAFRDHVFIPFGCQSIYSDQDPALLSNEFEEFCAANDVEIRTTKPYCPFSNGLVEKYQSYLQNAIRIYSKQTGLPYQELLGLIQKSLNRRLLSVKPYRFTPELLMFGNSLPTSHELLSVSEPNLARTPSEFCDTMMQNLGNLRTEYLTKRNKINDQNREIINRNRVQKSFQPGDIVYVRDLTIAHTAGGALKSKFVGPFVIESVNDTRLECTLQSLIDKKRCIRHMTHLKKQDALDSNNFVPSQIEDNNLVSDDVIETNDNADIALERHISHATDPITAIDDIETEPLFEQNDQEIPNTHSTLNIPPQTTLPPNKRRASSTLLLPTRKSARIRADDYTHSGVTIRK